MCLFYLNSKGTLLPVAIQLFAKPGPENPVSANYYHPRMPVGNVFGHVCVSVCVSVCSGYNFWTASHEDFIFSILVHLDHI